MSSKLYEKLKNINLDYDPVINGQDIDPNWKKTLSIKYIKEGNLYEVYTINSFDNSKNYTYLKVEKSKNGYKIYDIKVNDISSILSYLNDGEENGNRIEKTNTEYSADGTWKTNCDKGLGSMTIEGKSASLVLLYNQIYIELTEVKRYDFEKGISYKLKEIPEDLGSIGIHLNWKEYLNDEPIAYLKKIDDNTINFYWYGFYNKKTKKREFKDNSFYQETEMENIVLKKCED
jgi:hypothetical protein